MGWLSGPVDWTVAIVGLLAALALLLVWHVRLWQRLLSRPVPYHHVERLSAPDGGRFELRRVAADEALPRPEDALPPVLLVHGICANHRNQDLDAQTSLARHLTARGRDVWLLTLRSGRPLRLHGLKQPSGFSAMAHHDVPLAIERVLAATGCSALDYVGFSMGGMLLYAGLGRTIAERSIRRVVVVGSPARVQPPRGVPRVLRYLPRALVPPVLTGTLGTMFAPMAEWVATPAHKAVVNPANVAAGTTRLALVDCVQDVPGGLLADFMKWATTDGVVRLDGQDVLAGVTGLAIPALFVAGSADQIATVPAVRAAYDAWGRDQPRSTKQWLELGRRAGAAQDYGHGDLAVGCRLAEELHPTIASFLDAGDSS
jgi:pimeloyl-ACP methyl ester carboxylesterase